jgi:hypothetical protein
MRYLARPFYFYAPFGQALFAACKTALVKIPRMGMPNGNACHL